MHVIGVKVTPRRTSSLRHSLSFGDGCGVQGPDYLQLLEISPARIRKNCMMPDTRDLACLYSIQPIQG
ncbi:hypothetical protein CEP51_012487 [Fusarium floridanum]|uniref:Uncharacterized protein n=1 Tax=Fusarium floridanum TaxID=1325733 RepID=A0A428QT98_9HYPO|nr:hypothetical protein CEP51_012487 [Fusarium floridanum]